MTKKTARSPKIALALGSGSSRGWAHLGVLSALADLGVEADIVCGCSIGGLVGAAYTAGNLGKLEAWVRSLTKLETARFFELNFSLNGFINTDRFHAFLTDYVCGEDANIEDMQKVFATVSTELETGREIWFTDGSLIESVWASISIPGLFPPYQHEGRWMVDGGLVNPVPVSICRALGADIVIAVNLNGDIVGKHFVEKPLKKSESGNGFIESLKESAIEYSNALFPSLKEKANTPGLLDAIAGSINITQDRITRSRMAGDPPDVLLSPKLSHIGLLEFYRGNEAIQEGISSVERKRAEIEFIIKRG